MKKNRFLKRYEEKHVSESAMKKTRFSKRCEKKTGSSKNFKTLFLSIIKFHVNSTIYN